jgi:hypothetical protein
MNKKTRLYPEEISGAILGKMKEFVENKIG